MDAFEEGLIAFRPSLESFAMTLCKNRTDAQDLVQETLMKALRGRHLFEQGTRLNAWLLIIMRNSFLSAMRGRKFVDDRSPDNPNDHVAMPAIGPVQESAVMLAQTLEALRLLPEGMRVALELIGLSQFSYDEAAYAMEVPVGTVKSRVTRGRIRLAALLEEGYRPTTRH